MADVRSPEGPADSPPTDAPELPVGLWGILHEWRIAHLEWSQASGLTSSGIDAAAEKIRSALRGLAQLAPTTFFLIEDPQRHPNDTARWWTGERLQFSPDADDAARFTSRPRAESAMQPLGLSHLIVTAHMWPNEPVSAHPGDGLPVDPKSLGWGPAPSEEESLTRLIGQTASCFGYGSPPPSQMMMASGPLHAHEILRDFLRSADALRGRAALGETAPDEKLVTLAAQRLCSLDHNVTASEVERHWNDENPPKWDVGHYYVMAREVLALRGRAAVGDDPALPESAQLPDVGNTGETRNTVEQKLVELVAHLEALDSQLTRLGEGEFVEGYQMQTGAWHRILGLIRGSPLVTAAQFAAQIPDQRRVEAAFRKAGEVSQKSLDYEVRRVPPGRDTPTGGNT